MVGPLLFALVLAFYHWDGFGTRSFAGWSNFTDVLSDPRIQRSAVNTVWFTVLQVPGLMITGLFFAVLMQRAGKLTPVYRLAFFAPVVTSSVAVAAIWLWLSTPTSARSTRAARDRAAGAELAAGPRFHHPGLRDRRDLAGPGLPVGDVHGRAGEHRPLVPGSRRAGRLLGVAEAAARHHPAAVPDHPVPLDHLDHRLVPGLRLHLRLLRRRRRTNARTIVYEVVQIAFGDFNFGRGLGSRLPPVPGPAGSHRLQLAAQKRWVHYTE